MITTLPGASIRPDDGPRSPAAGVLRQLLPGEQDVLFRAARALTRRPDEAADLVQETCLRALRAEHRLDLRPFGVRPWLLTILRNVFLNQRGSLRRRGPALPPDDRLPAAPSSEARPAPDGAFDWEQIDGRLKAAVQALPGRHRDVLLRRAVEGRSYAGIAAELDIPVGTVMSRLHRARQLVARSLRRHGRADRRDETTFSFSDE